MVGLHRQPFVRDLLECVQEDQPLSLSAISHLHCIPHFYIMVPDRETCSETNAFAAVTCVKVARTPLPQSSVSSDVLMRADTLRTLGNLAADNANTQPMWARTGQLPLLPDARCRRRPLRESLPSLQRASTLRLDASQPSLVKRRRAHSSRDHFHTPLHSTH